MVDQLALDYAGEPVVLIEQNVDNPLGNRAGRWWSAFGSGSVRLPLSMVDSGHEIHNDYTDYASSYAAFKTMIDGSLARPPQAEITASSERIGNKVHFNVQVTNQSGVTLGLSNSATVNAIVYEEHTPTDVNTDHITGRIVRAAVNTGITTDLAHSASASFTLETGDLTNVVDWNKIHAVVLVDYLPAGSTGAYDMLQAAQADPGAPPEPTSTHTPTPTPTGSPPPPTNGEKCYLPVVMRMP